MEDDKIKELLSNFQPELPSGVAFLSKLRQNIDAVEMVKRQVAAQRRRNRIAVFVAAAFGFVSGVAMTLMAPAMCEWISSVQISLPSMGSETIAFDARILSWMITAAVSGLIAYNTYQITVSRLSAKTIGI